MADIVRAAQDNQPGKERDMDGLDSMTDALKAAWRRGQLPQCGISYDTAMSTPYLRAALIGTVRAQQRTAARHARSMKPYND